MEATEATLDAHNIFSSLELNILGRTYFEVKLSVK